MKLFLRTFIFFFFFNRNLELFGFKVSYASHLPQSKSILNTKRIPIHDDVNTNFRSRTLKIYNVKRLTVSISISIHRASHVTRRISFLVEVRRKC